MFVYFFFKGTFDPRLIFHKIDYLKQILIRPDIVLSCFDIFIYNIRKDNYSKANQAVTDYILLYIEGKDLPCLDKIVLQNQNLKSYWSSFRDLAYLFCFDKLSSDKNNKVNLIEFDGTGYRAVPLFATWTNVIDIDENEGVLNHEYAKERAIQRYFVKSEEELFQNFEEWEYEQEIH